MYLGSLSRANYDATENGLTPANVGSITPRWQTALGSSVSAQPVISHGIVYWGAWDGYERATTTSGRQVWSTFLGTTKPPAACRSGILGVGSTPTIGTVTIDGRPRHVLFVGGGNASLYALDAQSGKVIWSRSLGPRGSAFVWSSPAFFGGSVFIGMSSVGDCPLVGGKVFQIGAARGIVHYVFNTMGPGCVGAGVWGSVALDTAHQRLYFATGNANPCKGQDFGESMVE